MRIITKEMIHLCDQMLLGKSKPENPQKIGPFTIYTYAYGNAIMMQRKSKIK